jgi:hypothetical protein
MQGGTPDGDGSLCFLSIPCSGPLDEAPSADPHRTTSFDFLDIDSHSFEVVTPTVHSAAIRSQGSMR